MIKQTIKVVEGQYYVDNPILSLREYWLCNMTHIPIYSVFISVCFGQVTISLKLFVVYLSVSQVFLNTFSPLNFRDIMIPLTFLQCVRHQCYAMHTRYLQNIRELLKTICARCKSSVPTSSPTPSSAPAAPFCSGWAVTHWRKSRVYINQTFHGAWKRIITTFHKVKKKILWSTMKLFNIKLLLFFHQAVKYSIFQWFICLCTQHQLIAGAKNFF